MIPTEKPVAIYNLHEPKKKGKLQEEGGGGGNSEQSTVKLNDLYYIKGEKNS